MLKGYMIRERLGIPALAISFRLKVIFLYGVNHTQSCVRRSNLNDQLYSHAADCYKKVATKLLSRCCSIAVWFKDMLFGDIEIRLQCNGSELN